MDSGFYAAVNGARRIGLRLEVLANNLANADTTGFKADRMSFESFMTRSGPEQFPLPTDSFMGLRGPGDIPFPFSNPTSNALPMSYPMVVNTETDMTQGGFQQTGGPLDVAIEGQGFFQVNTPEGPRYTRDGSFSLNPQGELVTKDGYQVAGAGGAAIVITEGPVTIAKDGTLSDANGPIGQLARFELPPEQMDKVGQNLYRVPEGTAQEILEEGEGGFVQGFLETSNTNTILGMTQMIESHRAFETYMKMIRALDGLDEQAVSQVGRMR